MITPIVDIRNDDVLQPYPATPHHKADLRGRNPFDAFLETDKILEKYNYPSTLAIISTGIELFPEWVEHIKKNQHRYTIQLHGFQHDYYCNINKISGEHDLRRAKKHIEETFGVEITHWYMPFGRRRCPDWADEVCESMGLTHDGRVGKIEVKMWLKTYKNSGVSRSPQLNYHYWHDGQSKAVREIVELTHNINCPTPENN